MHKTELVKDFISFALSTTKTYKLILLAIEKKITDANEGFVTQYDNIPRKSNAMKVVNETYIFPETGDRPSSVCLKKQNIRNLCKSR